jgi:hypothetical protein
MAPSHAMSVKLTTVELLEDVLLQTVAQPEAPAARCRRRC